MILPINVKEDELCSNRGVLNKDKSSRTTKLSSWNIGFQNNTKQRPRSGTSPIACNLGGRLTGLTGLIFHNIEV